ncbi:hypothetical protein BPOR_0032g00280 [Botrytis porri]|uniref:Uncharacterized protein n=1 Tax=Botrytis porri TaxID=87229 RepID=A0A4Z1L3E5_9HELO|nr:hypothetical protein BPOR_0032g00280 [Botrytis porri]
MSLKGKEVELPREVFYNLHTERRMTPEDKALYERIATLKDPKSVTRAEKNQLFGLRPPDEEDRLCLEKIGLTVSELNDKIMSSSDTLSDSEVTISMFGVTHVPGSLDSDEKWRVFGETYNMTADIVLGRSWRRAFTLIETHPSRFVSDPLLDEANIDDFRQRFITMRKRDELANGRATDHFLVVDDTVLDHNVTSLKTSYKPKLPGKPDPWDSTLPIRAVDPDYNNTVSMKPESNTSDFPGEITISLLKVFDWLY